jgi:transposase
MKKGREILRLKFHHRLGNRKIARSCNVSKSTVTDYVRRARRKGLGNWESISELTEGEVESQLFDPPKRTVAIKPVPDWNELHAELRAHRHLTLLQLWSEYRSEHPDGYGYSQFCWRYEQWKRKLDRVMRQNHKGGEKLFVDYGTGPWLTDPHTGEREQTQLFVAVWGASNYTYVEASLSQELPNWIGSHVSAYEYFGCVPHITVPDNLRSGVSRACRYEPDLNPTYHEFACFYSTAIIPARPFRARDKASVEAGVLLAKRWIVAVLRHQIFHTLEEVNAAIAQLLERLNTRPFRKLKMCRRELFERVDRPNALALPVHCYQYAEWRKATVNIDYHICADHHYYSVPHQLVGEEVDIRIAANTVEVLHRGGRVAGHERSYEAGKYTTKPEHMPESHRRYLEWTPSRILEEAEQIGTSTKELVDSVLRLPKHPEQNYRSALGIIRLQSSYGKDRLEKAAKRALCFHSFSYTAVKNILSAGLDQVPVVEQETNSARLLEHENVRGPSYYQN